jgi:hypothetical protein
MSLVNFDDDVVETTTTTNIKQPAPVLTQTVTTKPVASGGAKHVLKPAEQWGWEEVRDYVVSSIEARHGAFPRNFKTEGSIFKSFTNRWGTKAGAIAKAAFEEFDGMWKGAPISVNRFCVGSDPYFAAPLSERV